MTNSAGTNRGEVKSFTTPDGEGGGPSTSPQTITFPALSTVTAGDPAQTMSATATSGLTVTYTSQTSSICTVSGSTVTPIAAGTCTVAADQAGDSEYDPAPQQTRSFLVSPRAQTITFPALSDMTTTTPAQAMSATATSGLTVTYTSQTPSVCTVSGATVVPVSSGACTILADQAGDAAYAAAPQASRSIDIDKTAQSVTLDPVDDIKLNEGPAEVTATPSRSVPVTLTTLTTSVCTAGVDGEINLVSAGTCTIRASVEADELYLAAQDEVSFEVVPPFVVEEPEPVQSPKNGPVSISVGASGGVGPYTWEVAEGSSLPDGLELDETTGEITGTPTTPGEYEILIAVTDGGGETIVRTLRLVVLAAATAPSGNRIVVAGERVWLPDSVDPDETWTYTVPASFVPDGTSPGRRWYRVSAQTSGIVDVPLHVTGIKGTATGTFRVKVHPPAVTGGQYGPRARLSSALTWTAVPGAGVRGYRVHVDGRLVGRTTATRLSLGKPLGPRSRVEVVTEGNSELLSTTYRLKYKAPKKVANVAVGATVYFDTASSTLDKGDRAILKRIAKTVRKTKLRHVQVTGFTDSQDSHASNQALSERRADAVRAFLKSRLRGVKLSWSGRSENTPAASNATAAGMAKNRRVEIKVW